MPRALVLHPVRSASQLQKLKGFSKGGRAILCRIETTPEDLRGMIAAEGILCPVSVSSHAALVARQMNKVCVCGAAEVVINYSKEIKSERH